MNGSGRCQAGIQATNLTKRVDHLAVNNVDLQVAKGQIFG